MYGTTIKIIDAQQAKLRNSYKNTKLKLIKSVTLARISIGSLKMVQMDRNM
jgi:hypothetical protein